ncbi:DNA primase [Pseudomonas sp. S1(2024)]|uniref:DNA primase n=1 Tax=Pseudomonas sp. S1(2024) TaxID=3390191 RepID=UPI00397E6466
MTTPNGGAKRPLDRIPQTVLDDIVDQNDLLEIIGRHIPLKKQGKDYVSLCPFHKEHSPSFSVSPGRQFYYCFGCGASGNALDFMMAFTGRSFIAVAQDLAEDVGIDLKPYLRSAKKEQLDFQMLPAMKAANDYFVQELSRPGDHARTALEYLASRSIPLEMIERFSLGFAGYGKHTVDNLVEHQAALIEGGVLEQSERGVFSLFRDRLVMPVRDMKGKPIGLSGRTLRADAKPKYRNSKESALFSRNSVLYGLYESLKAFGNQNRLERLFIVEGQFDVIAHHLINLAAAAAMGSSMSVHQLRLLLRYTKHVTFIFDGDAAGIKALVQVGSLLLENITDHEVVFDVILLPEGEDPHSLVIKDPEAYQGILAQPLDWLDAMLHNLPEAKDLVSDRGRAEFASKAIELIHETRDPLLRHQALERAASICGMPVEALRERLVSMPTARSAYVKPENALNDNALRLTRILWDEPLWAEDMIHDELWKAEGDELIQTLVDWKVEMLKGELDLLPSHEDHLKLEENPYYAPKLEVQCRQRGAAASLGRRLGGLQNPAMMAALMRDEPETSRSTAQHLIQHITGVFAAQAMQKLSNKAALTGLTSDDQMVFANLHKIRRESVIRTKNA